VWQKVIDVDIIASKEAVSDPWINHDLFTIFRTINSVLTAQARIFYG